MPFLLVLVLLASVGRAAAAQPARVIDGDTLDVGGERIRLWGIDSPEGNQIASATVIQQHTGLVVAVA